jgi:hypothetical protein
MSHYHLTRTVRTLLLIIAAGLLPFAGIAAIGAEEAHFKGALRTESTGQAVMETSFWVSAEQLRMDTTQPMAMTVIWSFGAKPSLHMILHDKRVYVEWGPKELENARQMVQRANQRTSSKDVDELRFEPTGAHATVGGKNAFEVRLQIEEKEDGRSIWLSSDVDYGLVEFFAHYARALHGTTQFPMTGTDNDPLGLGNGFSLPLDKLGSAGGLDGRVVRIVDDGSGSEPPMPTTITLHSVESGPFSDDPFDVPDGYVRKNQLSSNVL